MKFLDLAIKPDRTQRETWFVNYVRDIGKQLEVPFETLDVGPLITLEGPSNSPTEINKFLFSRLQEIKAPVKVNLTDSQRRKLRGLNHYFNTRSSSIEALRTHVVRCANDLASNIAALNLEIEQERNLKRVSPVVEVQKIVDATGWTLTEDIGDSYIGFITKNIMMKDPNLEWSADLGKYKIQLAPSHNLENVVIVKRHEDNITANGYLHPFIGSGGKVCWGGSISDAAKLYGERNYVGLMLLLQELLSTYVGHPYVTLIDLVVKSRPISERYPWQKAVIEKYIPEAIDKRCICDSGDCEICHPFEDEPDLEVEDEGF